MGKVYPEINERIAKFIRKQRVFFVATSPRADDGLVNLSPKGLEGLAILGPNRVAYLDMVGSGIETVAHLRENGRIVLMFCSFEGPPNIVRLHGRGEVVEPGDDGWEALAENFSSYVNTRSIICIDVTRISDSCGFGVPLYEYTGDRRQLHEWSAKSNAEEIAQYKQDNNHESLDGLPGLRRL